MLAQGLLEDEPEGPSPTAFPEAHLQVLTDEQATVTHLREGISSLLGDAGAGDAILLTFSGHGSQDHRLVAYVTDLTDLTATTLGMDELAEMFRKSNAGAIFCVLDCCFSGAAPARVLEGTPITRNPASPLVTLAGTGRIFLSAASPNRYALEHPTRRHGLLTLALIEALQHGEVEHDLLTVASSTQSVVRAQALSLGALAEKPRASWSPCTSLSALAIPDCQRAALSRSRARRERGNQASDEIYGSSPKLRPRRTASAAENTSTSACLQR